MAVFINEIINKYYENYYRFFVIDSEWRLSAYFYYYCFDYYFIQDIKVITRMVANIH